MSQRRRACGMSPPRSSRQFRFEPRVWAGGGPCAPAGCSPPAALGARSAGFSNSAAARARMLTSHLNRFGKERSYSPGRGNGAALSLWITSCRIPGRAAPREVCNWVSDRDRQTSWRLTLLKVKASACGARLSARNFPNRLRTRPRRRPRGRARLTPGANYLPATLSFNLNVKPAAVGVQGPGDEARAAAGRLPLPTGGTSAF